MKKIEINKGYNNYVLEYDDTTYDIKYCKFDKSFVLTDKKGNVINVFPRTIGFIKQVNVEDKTYFMVSNRVVIDNFHKGNVLKKYQVVDGSLEVRESYETSSLNYADVVLDYCSFLIDSNGTKNIHSLYGDKTTRDFTRVIKDDKFMDVLGTNIVVEEAIIASNYRGIPDVYDVITYGIAPNSLEIVTKIYSKEQNRYISLLSKEEIDKKSKEFHIKNKPFEKLDPEYKKVMLTSDMNRTIGDLVEDEDVIGSRTILFEIVKPLQELVNDKTNEIYNNKEVSEFIKKLGE